MNNNKKLITISIIVLLFNFLLIFLLKKIVFEFNDFSIFSKCFIGSCTFSLLLGMYFISLFLFKKFWQKFLFYFILNLIPVLIFANSFYFIFILFIGVILFFISDLEIKKSQEIFVTFKTKLYFNRIYGFLSNFLLLLIILSFFFYAVNNRKTISVSEYLDNKVFESIMSRFINDYSSDITVDEYLEDKIPHQNIEASIKEAYGDQLFMIDFDKITFDEEEKALKQLRKEFCKTFDTELTGEEKLSNVIRNYFDKEINTFILEPKNKYFYGGIKSLILFFIISAIIPVIKFFALLLAMVFVRILLDFEVFKIKKQEVEKELFVLN